MAEFLHQLIENSARLQGGRAALFYKQTRLDYTQLWQAVVNTANGFCHCGIGVQERIAVYLPKQFETVISFFAAAKAGAVFVPVNPGLKAEQVEHILRDCNARIFVTSASRLRVLIPMLSRCSDLHQVVCIDTCPEEDRQSLAAARITVTEWRHLNHSGIPHHRVIDTQMVSILYTSGSTGKPKGVVLSHRNMVAGAISVSSYLENTANDILLAVLPFSFDYGFSQLSTAFHVGASVVLMDYLVPRDVIKAVASNQVTGLAAVPPLWIQLAPLEWPAAAQKSLRYFTNSGGAMPVTTLTQLRQQLPHSKPFLMYGLTEAFRSTYLPPDQIDQRPDSMGKAIPNADVMVVREDGSPCVADEPGELVHKGALVAMGYWNDPLKTAERFKPAPSPMPELPLTEIAVWSGDTVRMDSEGYLYFIGRRDEMIKTSGYRVSPTEVEEVLYQTGLVREVVAMGVPHPTLGQAIVVMATAKEGQTLHKEELVLACRQHLPLYMVPAEIFIRDSLPRNQNGKLDRKHLSSECQDLFVEAKP